MEEKEPYFQVPKSLFRLRRDGGISLTAFDIYILMVDRYRLSLKNKQKYIDKNGEIFFYYSYDELCQDLCIKKRTLISNAIKELIDLKLIKKRRRFNASTAFYISDQIVTSDLLVTSNQKVPNESNQKVPNESNQKVHANKNNKSKNYYSKNYYNKNNNRDVVENLSPIKNQIRLEIGNRNLKIENILKHSNNIERIREVFEYANTNEKTDAWIIACLRDNYVLKKKEEFESTALRMLREREKGGMDGAK